MSEITPTIVRYVPKPGSIPAIICDLDGTLAIFDGLRGPYEYEKCVNDLVNKPIRNLIQDMSTVGYEILYVSGREDRGLAGTQKFLRDHDCPDGQLWMRKTGDYRKDSIIKGEIFDAHIRDVYDIAFVLDDRPVVIRMWQSLGLTTLAVGPLKEF